MEENKGQVATQSQQTGQFQCTGDCLRCSKEQRAYCACQHTYNSMRMTERMEQLVIAIEEHFRDVKKMIEAIQNSEAMVFDPSEASELPEEVMKPIGTL